MIWLFVIAVLLVIGALIAAVILPGSHTDQQQHYDHTSNFIDWMM